ncbi:phenylacetate-CoA oxygenase subunit PaaC [Flavihumibacter rivuli]|uniref:1,2-phenylacetyl-CoA epoxidase subunit PaaC n=1 Tax=Flavihumibacter rivuli TaxID=2838156 RepID=UPI001BDE7A66|nr:1,2-phenylacetyl-CoA epoxidase subunit PaaC [Flavihumibacter rivuli]ULQ55304.1 phenylacetate-CoA oxygenase subunit PaaC [Flavihumibacter rivuli]
MTALFQYVLHLADNALILGHRNSEWTGHGPVLEQDIAISNIALDLIGQSRNLYQYAAGIYEQHKEGLSSTIGSPAFQMVKGAVDEDDLAFLRDANEFYNLLLVEQDNGDWAKTILRQFLFSAYQFELYNALQKSKDSNLSAIAEKALKEVTYHVRWSGEWVIRLGDGTEESHRRMVNALDALWKFSDEMFQPALYEKELAATGSCPDPSTLKTNWMERVSSTLTEATLEIPVSKWMQTGGKIGVHTEHLGFLLAEMQFMQRTYPNSEW